MKNALAESRKLPDIKDIVASTFTPKKSFPRAKNASQMHVFALILH
jgi:hypothetical protein